MMSKEKPSRTASKVALNIVTLGAEPGMDEVLPDGIVETTAKLLVESGKVIIISYRYREKEANNVSCEGFTAQHRTIGRAAAWVVQIPVFVLLCIIVCIGPGTNSIHLSQK